MRRQCGCSTKVPVELFAHVAAPCAAWSAAVVSNGAGMYTHVNHAPRLAQGLPESVTTTIQAARMCGCWGSCGHYSVAS